MKIIKIPNKINNTTVEEILLKVNESTDDYNLQLPIDFNYRGFGILPSLLLILFSWVRKSKGKLIIPISIDNKEAIKNYANDYFGYTVLSTVWKSTEIVNEEGVSLKEDFRKHTLRMHDKLDFFEGLSNEALLIPCFDHYSKEKGLSHWFYINNFKYAESPSLLNNTIYRIFEYLGRIYTTRINANSIKLLDNLQTIVWELIKNTDEHAKKDYLNQIELSPNTRGIFIKIHRSSKAKFIENANNHKGLEEYYNLALNETDNFMLEISVFDSGPGMVKRFLGSKWNENVTTKEEVDTIKNCLIKGVTSVSGFQGKHKGFGLNNVLQTLNTQRGFLKIRSGHVSLYRNLIDSPYIETTEIDKVELKDWNTMNPSKFSKMDFTAGTLITMAYPINETK
ncbi:MAG: hypothetical protein V4677_11140 [Bacteroidota bacterium]